MINTLEQRSAYKAQYLKDSSEKAILLLKELIQIPSYSKEEDKTADLLKNYLESQGVKVFRKFNNVWAINKYAKPDLAYILLNSHHDTVKPNAGYTHDPFEAIEKEGKIFGLGSNDAGASVVSLLSTFLYFYENPSLQYNLILALSAEEENSGTNGIEIILPLLGKISFAIVGEPTQMNMAIAEKGLMVLDCKTDGKAGHAAREEGVNAIYKAIKDIEWFQQYQFEKVSETLGAVKMSVTMIQSGTQHNIVPDECHFTVDVRSTDVCSNEEILKIVREHIQSEVKPRSMRLRPSSIEKNHPFVQAGIKKGKSVYGSPTTSDQALMPFPSLKMGPGDSARSHTADEFIYRDEIRHAIADYIELLEEIIL